jgi:hypothetical protein
VDRVIESYPGLPGLLSIFDSSLLVFHQGTLYDAVPSARLFSRRHSIRCRRPPRPSVSTGSPTSSYLSPKAVGSACDIPVPSLYTAASFGSSTSCSSPALRSGANCSSGGGSRHALLCTARGHYGPKCMSVLEDGLNTRTRTYRVSQCQLIQGLDPGLEPIQM